MGLLEFIKCVLLNYWLFQIRNSISPSTDIIFLSLSLLCCPRWMVLLLVVCLNIYVCPSNLISSIKICHVLLLLLISNMQKIEINGQTLAFKFLTLLRNSGKVLPNALNVSLPIFFRLSRYDWNSLHHTIF